MQLTDEQKQKVSAWLADGLKRLTYMDVRMLVGDLKLVPVDPPEPVVEKPEPTPAEAAAPAAASTPVADVADAPAQAASNISLTVDQIAHPGTIVSGGVTFNELLRAVDVCVRFLQDWQQGIAVTTTTG